MKMSKRWSKLCWDKRRWITGLADGEGAGSQTANKKPGNKSGITVISNVKYNFQSIFSKEVGCYSRGMYSEHPLLPLRVAMALPVLLQWLPAQATANGQQGVSAWTLNSLKAARIFPDSWIKQSFNIKSWKKLLLSGEPDHPFDSA